MTTLSNRSTAAPATTPNLTRYLALSSVAGPILGTLAWLVLGLLRPGYSSVSRPISALGVGPRGAFMDGAFILTGVLIIVAVIPILRESRREMETRARRVCMVVLMVSPLGLIWLGIFPLNRLVLHSMGAQLALGGPIVTFPIIGLLLRRVPSWRLFGTWMLIGSPLTLVLLVGFIGSVPPSQFVTGGGYLGLWQRALATEVLAWYAAMGWLAFKHPLPRYGRRTV